MTQLHARHELMYGDVKLFAGTACPELAQQIADHLGIWNSVDAISSNFPMRTCSLNCINR